MTDGRKLIRKIAQWTVRVVFLLAALGLGTGSPLPSLLARVFPGLSPLVAAASSIAQRRWYLGLYWFGPPLAVLLLGVWKGRLFCRWVCPAGTVYAAGAQLSLKKRILKVRLNVYVFWIIVGASLVGAPLLLLLDPLSTFNRLTPLLTGTYTIASLVPGLLVPLFLLLGFVQPMIWCTHLCPLGYLLELSRSVRREPKKTFLNSRRQILTGLLIGVPLSALARVFLLARDRYEQAPILPPGAEDLETFAALCTRCYACVDVCPYRVIRVGLDLDRAPGQLFQPEVAYFDGESRGQPDWGCCPEWCNACSQACPTGALTPLTLEQKRHRQMGTAEVIRSACLAWEDGQDCSVCQEVCPYHAVELDETEDGRARPIINQDLCRGCGACYSKCPAVRVGKAIVMRGVRRQRQLTDEEAGGAGPQTGSAEPPS